MSDGMSEAYRRRTVRKKVNKNVSLDIDFTSKAIRITNLLDGDNAVEIKIKTLNRILEIVNETMQTKE